MQAGKSEEGRPLRARRGAGRGFLLLPFDQACVDGVSVVDSKKLAVAHWNGGSRKGFMCFRMKARAHAGTGLRGGAIETDSDCEIRGKLGRVVNRQKSSLQKSEARVCVRAGLSLLPWLPIAFQAAPAAPNPAYTRERGFHVLPPESSLAGETEVQSFLGNRPVFRS